MSDEQNNSQNSWNTPQPNWGNNYNTPNNNWENNYNNNNLNNKPQINGYVIAAFISSLISILFCCCNSGYIPVPIILAAGSIVFAILSKQKKKMHGLSIAAIIISIFAIIGFLFVFAMKIYIQSPEGQSYINQFYKEFYNQNYNNDSDNFDSFFNNNNT